MIVGRISIHHETIITKPEDWQEIEDQIREAEKQRIEAKKQLLEKQIALVKEINAGKKPRSPYPSCESQS